MQVTSGYCANTEILARRGWLQFDQLADDDEVATRSPTGRFEWQRPSGRVGIPYSGTMLHFRSQVFNLLITPDCRMLVRRRPKADRLIRDAPEVKPAHWFADAGTRATNWAIPTTSVWRGEAPEQIVVPAAQRALGRHHPAQELRFSVDVWARFLGWYLSEGSVTAAVDAQNYIYISQSKREHFPEIENTLTAMGTRWRRDGENYYFCHGPLGRWLRATCYTCTEYRAWNKRIPASVKEYPPALLEELFTALVKGDGHVEKLNGLRRYATTSPRLADDVIEIIQKKGGQGWYYLMPKSKEHHHQGYKVTDRPGDYGHVPVPKAIQYDGTIHNVRVSNGIVHVRRHGRTAWCGGN